MPSHVGSCDGNVDLDNFLHLFEGAICSIINYKDLKAKFRSHFSQQKRFIKTHLAVHNIKQREGESVRAYATRTRNLVEHLSTDLPSTYKGLMEKTYTWIEAREVATNGAPNDQRDNFERSRKSSWDNGRGQKSRDRFSLYRGLCMRTRSSGPVVEPSTTPRRRRNKKHSQQVDPTIVEKPVVTMADTRTMAELLQAPTEGYGDAIVIPAILAENFELKHGLLNLVTSKQFCGFEKEDPHAHIRWFNKITSTIKYKDVPNSSIKLMLFPFSIEGAARIWLEKEPPRSIVTWEDLVSKFINQFFPPSKTTNLRNEITNFQQRFDESFLSTNTATSGLSPDVAALTDAIKALLLKNITPPPASVKAVEESCVTCGRPHPYYQCLATDGNASGYQDNIQAYVSAAAVNYNQGNAGHRPPSVAHQVRPPGFPPVQNNQNRGNNYNQGNSTYRAPTQPTQAAPSNELANYMKVNDTNMRAMQNQITNMKTELKNEFQATMLQQNNKLENMLSNYFQMNKPSGSGSLPSNTVVNPKGDLKAITTRSGVSYDGPPFLLLIPRLVEKRRQGRGGGPRWTRFGASKYKKGQPPDPKALRRDDHQMMKFLQIFQSLHFDLSFSDALLCMPKFASTFKNLLSNKEKLFELANTSVNENCSAVILEKFPKKLGDPGKFLIPFVDYVVDPRVPLILGRPFLRTARALIDVYDEELTLRVSDEAITFKVEVLGFSDNSESGNPTLTSEPIIAKSSPSLTPFEGGDFILEEIEAYLASDSVPSGIDDDEFNPEGDIRLIERYA
ncbi:reverse transcriptase domain-containing protein [Tanacetum coccineum]